MALESTSWLGRHLHRSSSLMLRDEKKANLTTREHLPAREQVPEIINIPLKNGGVLEFNISSHLPKNPKEISSILREESSPPSSYLSFALEYYYRGEGDSFLSLIEDGLLCESNTNTTNTIIPLLTSKASYFIQELLKNNLKDQETLNLMIMQSLNEAEKINQLDFSLLLRKAFFLYSKGSIRGAQSLPQLKILLQQAEKSSSQIPFQIAAHLLIACQLYDSANRNWEEILLHLRCITQTLLPSSSPPELFLLEAVCMDHLSQESSNSLMSAMINNYGENLSPTLLLNVHLVKGFSLLRGNQIKEGMEEIKKAYLIKNNDPNACLQIALHFFHSNNLERCEEFLGKINDSPNDGITKRLRSDILLLRGRLFLLKSGNHDSTTTTTTTTTSSSIKSLSEAVRQDPEHPLAQYYLGQILIKSGGPLLAAGIECLQRVRELKPPGLMEDYHFWSLYSLSLIKLGSNNGDNVDIKYSLELALRIIKNVSGEERLKYDLLSQGYHFFKDSKMLDEAIVLGEKGCFSGLSILKKNRMAQYLSDGQYEEVDQTIIQDKDDIISSINYAIYLRGIHNLKESLEEINVCITIIERMKKGSGGGGGGGDEELSSIDLNRLHIKILLLKGCIEEDMNQVIDANETFKEVISSLSESSIDAWLLLSISQWRSGAIGPARKSFERILKGLDRHEPFSLHALGAMHYEFSFTSSESKIESLKRSLEFYVKALQIKPGSQRALLGIGCIFGELGQWTEAKDAFITVLSSIDDGDVMFDGNTRGIVNHPLSFFKRSVLLNLAHCQLELSLNILAIHSYREAFSLLDGTGGGGVGDDDTSSSPSSISWTKERVQILSHLSRALYCSSTKENLEECLEILEVLKRHLPSDLMISFNQGIARLLLGQITRSKEDVLCAIGELESLRDGKKPFNLKNLSIAIDRANQQLRNILEEESSLKVNSSSNEEHRLLRVSLEREKNSKRKKEEEEEEKRIIKEEEEESERIRQSLALKVKELDIRISSIPMEEVKNNNLSSNGNPKAKKLKKSKIIEKESSFLSKAEISSSDDE